jgi:hypothetical protein
MEQISFVFKGLKHLDALRIEGFVSTKITLDVSEKRNFCLCRDSKLRIAQPVAQSAYRQSYAGSK